MNTTLQDRKMISRTRNEKTTVYLNPRIKRGTQYYALLDDSSLSEIINATLADYLEDQADIRAAREALADDEAAISFSQAAKELGFNAHDIRRTAQAEIRSAAEKA